MNRYLACTAALMMPLVVSAQALAQPAATSTAPAAPMAHSTMAPASGAMTAPSSGSMASTAGTANLSATDKKFIAEAAHGGIAEVQMAQLAQQKTQSDTVKQFAQTMIDDHTPNNAQLVKLASSKGITPPTEPDAAQQKMMSKLQGLDGKKFDTAYLKGQVKAHNAMLKEFENESKNGTDPDLKQFADQTIPVIQKHITMAQSDKGA